MQFQIQGHTSIRRSREEKHSIVEAIVLQIRLIDFRDLPVAGKTFLRMNRKQLDDIEAIGIPKVAL